MGLDGFMWVVNGIGVVFGLVAGFNFADHRGASIASLMMAAICMLLSLSPAKGFWVGLGFGA
ncbi:MAG: hypothetical protein GY750_03780 [Lentisphaerae bacterium]|nr:hypothetical protein [Lentisphaerota bacterium]